MRTTPSCFAIRPPSRQTEGFKRHARRARLVCLLLFSPAFRTGDTMPAPIDIANETSRLHLPPETIEFYREAMQALENAGVPFLVGGAYAFARYTGIERYTKDFDIFVLPADFERALDAFAGQGWQAERSFPHWLGKTFRGDDFVDVIFSSGNGVARVDDLWFENAVEGKVLDLPVKLVPAEEMIWSKSFIMERERFDGADVAHVLYCRAADL